MQQKHIENDQYSSEIQTNYIPYFTARTLCTGPLREMRVIVVFLFWQKYRADHVMNRLLFGDDNNKAVLQMWNFCHWMESSRSVAGMWGGEISAQQGFGRIMWRHQVTWGKNVAQKRQLVLHWSKVTCISPICSEAYMLCLDERVCISPFERRLSV